MVLIVGAIGTVVAILALIWQIRNFKLNLSADLSLKLDERFWSRDFLETRSRAARVLKDRTAERDCEDVFDFFETVGLFVRRGALDAEFAHNFFFHWIVLYWVAGKEHIRKKQKESKLTWKDFEGLYEIVSRIEKKENRDSLDMELGSEKKAEFLQDEIDLVLATPQSIQTSEGQQ